VPRPKQLRLDDRHVALLNRLKNLLGVTYESEAVEMALRCFAESVAVALADAGNYRALDALLAMLNEASGGKTYHYDGEVLRLTSEGYKPVGRYAVSV
jgi:hypothetical protein